MKVVCLNCKKVVNTKHNKEECEVCGTSLICDVSDLLETAIKIQETLLYKELDRMSGLGTTDLTEIIDKCLEGNTTKFTWIQSIVTRLKDNKENDPEFYESYINNYL